MKDFLDNPVAEGLYLVGMDPQQFTPGFRAIILYLTNNAVESCAVPFPLGRWVVVDEEDIPEDMVAKLEGGA